MFAATFYDVYRSRDILQFDDVGVFMLGFVASFVSALLAVRGLLRFISHHDFTATSSATARQTANWPCYAWRA